MPIVTNVPAATVSTGNVSNAGTKRFHWGYCRNGWKGLEAGSLQRTPLKTPWEMSGLTVLSAVDTHGGGSGLRMAELSWHLHSRARWMISTGGGHIMRDQSDGDIIVFQTRKGVDF